MITLSTFQQFESLEQELNDFIIEKCTEFAEARGWTDANIKEHFEDWELTKTTINVFFNDNYWYELPLDILFNSDFKTKFKERVDEEKRLELIRFEEAEARRNEAKRQEKIEMLKMLMKEFPDVVKEGV